MNDPLFGLLLGVLVAVCFYGGLAVCLDKDSHRYERVLGAVLALGAACSTIMVVLSGMPDLIFGVLSMLIMVPLIFGVAVLFHDSP